jgi:predicted N-acetyltransferase YhbS
LHFYFPIDILPIIYNYLKELRVKFKIAYLADYPQFIPTIGEWLFNQWGRLSPDGSLEKSVLKVQASTNKDRVPFVLVAISNAKPLGIVCVVENDLETRADLTPWLAGVLVLPAYRHYGVGRELCLQAEKEMQSLGIKKAYLFTPDKQPFYAKMGWQKLEDTLYRDEEVSVMEKDIKLVAP